LLEVRKRGQPRAKRQSVTAEIPAGAIQLSYATNVRRVGDGVIVSKTVWLVEVRLLDTNLDPWVLLTDWQVEEQTAAVRISRCTAQRTAESASRFVAGVL
jgi:hypothetical protein